MKAINLVRFFDRFIVGILFGILCCAGLFVTSRHFVNQEVTPYELAKLYETAGRHADALTIARQIIRKKIKIPSATITAIKNEMRQLLEKEGNRDSAIQGGTSDKSKSHKPWQGETPEVTPHGSALPP
jgi:hypothetical protein